MTSRQKLARLKGQGFFRFSYWVSYEGVTLNGSTSRGKCKFWHFLSPQPSKQISGSFHKICLKISNPCPGNSLYSITLVTFSSLLGWDVHRYPLLPSADYISKMQSLLVHTFQLSQTSVLFPVDKTLPSDFTEQGNHLHFNL